MDWSPGQDELVEKVDAWLEQQLWQEDPEQLIFRVDGFAGTGKTSTARRSVRPQPRPVYCAPTGKAALRMNQKGCDNAATVHKTIYQTKDQSKAYLQELEAKLANRILVLREAGDSEDQINVDEQVDQLRRLILAERKNLSTPHFTLNERSVVKDCSVVVLDEGSMVGGRLAKDLLSFKRPVLVLMDPGQLPPVKDEAFFSLRQARHTLTEIHRQAADDPIIWLSKLAREGKSLPLGQHGSTRVVDKSSLSKTQLGELVLQADQVIVWKNETRIKYNSRIRQLLGFETDDPDSRYPQVGDRLICLQNNYDEGLFNGGIFEVLDVCDQSELDVTLTIKSDDDESERVVTCHSAPFVGKQVPPWLRREANEFTYGYAITCHKAQGSEWDHVLVFVEMPSWMNDYSKWLYTAITRAAKTATIVLC